MPQRSTPFQKLVLHIQEQFAAGASVVESAMLRHRGTGSEREVDIVACNGRRAGWAALDHKMIWHRATGCAFA